MNKVRRYSWVGLLVIAGVVALFGAGDMSGGISADPGIALAMTGQTVEEVRETAPAVARLADLGIWVGGATMLTLGLLWTYIILVGVRTGEQLAWRSMWTMPLWLVMVIVVYLAAGRVPGTPPPPPLLSGPVLLVVSIGLLLVARPRAGDSETTVDVLAATPDVAPGQ